MLIRCRTVVLQREPLRSAAGKHSRCAGEPDTGVKVQPLVEQRCKKACTHESECVSSYVHMSQSVCFFICAHDSVGFFTCGGPEPLVFSHTVWSNYLCLSVCVCVCAAQLELDYKNTPGAQQCGLKGRNNKKQKTTERERP